MGVGHVPQEPIRSQSAGAQFQGPQHRRASKGRSLRQARGEWGEDLVATHYRRQGWRIIARNFWSKRGELDIVALRDGVLAVVEVKARRTADFGEPLESISQAKQLRIRRATQDFLAMIRDQEGLSDVKVNKVRYDAAGVLGTQVDIVEDAF